MPSRVGLKEADSSRCRTRCKSAGFHRGANLEPLCHPLQMAIRFLQHPLPTAPWPSLALGLPVPKNRRRIGFTSFPKMPSRSADQLMGLGTHYPPEVVSGNGAKYMTLTPRLLAFWPQLLPRRRDKR